METAVQYPINYISRYAKVDERDLQPIGFCDRTGIAFNHYDLHKQMEWQGNRLVWTGWLVGKPFLDLPDPQNRIPLIKQDPEIVNNPRDRLPARNLTQAQVLLQLMTNNYNV